MGKKNKCEKVKVYCMKGPMGPQGPAGPPGATGPQGPPGEPGGGGELLWGQDIEQGFALSANEQYTMLASSFGQFDQDLNGKHDDGVYHVTVSFSAEHVTPGAGQGRVEWYLAIGTSQVGGSYRVINEIKHEQRVSGSSTHIITVSTQEDIRAYFRNNVEMSYINIVLSIIKLA